MPVEIKELNIRINIADQSNTSKSEEGPYISSSEKEKDADHAFQDLIKALSNEGKDKRGNVE